MFGSGKKVIIFLIIFEGREGKLLVIFFCFIELFWLSKDK